LINLELHVIRQPALIYCSPAILLGSFQSPHTTKFRSPAGGGAGVGHYARFKPQASRGALR
jgi:hypothetical protein